MSHDPCFTRAWTQKRGCQPYLIGNHEKYKKKPVLGIGIVVRYMGVLYLSSH